MRKHPAVESLVRMMPPGGGNNARIDWDALNAAWGTSFPSDYMSFVATYGVGEISGALSILTPDVPGGVSPSRDGLGCETANARTMWFPQQAPHGPGTGPRPVIAWGVSAAADIICWLTLHDDPDRWPVAVLGTHSASLWHFYDCGMARFLERLFTQDFDECPLSDTTLWGNMRPRFLSQLE